MPLHRFPTALGPCELHHDGSRVTGFRLPGGTSDRPAAGAEPAPEWVRALAERVVRHLAGEPQDFADVPFAWEQVSSFQRAVYQAALHTKAGHTTTYGTLASRIGQPLAASRAVGTALGQNPWPLLVPCHRFIGAGGRMTGFSAPGGIKTKLKLLQLEGAELIAED